MHFRRTAILLGASVVVVACNTRLPRADSAPSNTAPVPNQSSLLAAPSVTPPNGAEPSNGNNGERLPTLKPVIGKPFPEGASQDVVCEAINSKETDLWARFGHLVPLDEQGVIYVLAAGNQMEAQIEGFVRKKYVYPSFTQQASCDGRTLLYVRKLPPDMLFGTHRLGQTHLSEELERNLGVSTIEQFAIQADTGRQAAYCRQDGELCDALLRLDVVNMARGLCAHIKSLCGRQLEGSPDALSQFEAACLTIPKGELACLEAAEVGPALRACEANLRRQICP